MQLIEQNQTSGASWNCRGFDLEFFFDIPSYEQYRGIESQSFLDTLFQVFHLTKILEANVSFTILGKDSVQFVVDLFL